MATANMTEDVCSALRRCCLFDGIPEERYPRLLERLKAKRACFRRDETILHIGDRSKTAGVVLSGCVALSFLDEGGNRVTVRQMGAHDVFGTELACLQGDASSLHLGAVSDCEILFLDFSVLMSDRSPLCPFRMKIVANLLRDFARQTQFLNRRLRVIGQKRLRDKIKICLQGLPADASGTIRLPFKRNEWADYLYADRSALSRELGRMSREGLISYHGRTIQVLDRDFLKN